LDNFPAENQTPPEKGRMVHTFLENMVWQIVSLSLHFYIRAGFFLLLLKNNSFEQWPSISDYMIYFIFFIILEDWIYFRDNKIVR
jgi:hypothetical protein